MLATATLKDTESKIEDDLARMKAFIQEATLFANQQAGSRQHNFFIKQFRGTCKGSTAKKGGFSFGCGIQNQGGLDLRYMTERYDRGKTWVAKYMEKHHRCCSNPLSQAHADLLHYQRGDHGGNGLLSVVRSSRQFSKLTLRSDSSDVHSEADNHDFGRLLVAAACHTKNKTCQSVHIHH